MLMFMLMFSCGGKTSDSTTTDTSTVEPNCVEWEDSCSGCTWMCTDISLKPDVVCDVECTEPHPEGECVLAEDECIFQ